MHATELVRTALVGACAYLGMGGLAAGWFHARGLAALDPGTHQAGIGFRILITPGLLVFWPYLLLRHRRPHPEPHPSPEPGEQEAGPSQRTLRRAHGLAWKVLAIAMPLVLGSALYRRPAPFDDGPLPRPDPAPVSSTP